MQKKDLTAIVVILAYSITVFAYIHSNFVGKDAFQMVLQSLERIETRLNIKED